MKDIFIKLLKILVLPLAIVAGAFLGLIGGVGYWYFWTFKEEDLYTKIVNNELKD